MSKYVSIDHDYIIMFCKDLKSANRFYAEYDKQYLKRYNEEDEKGKFFWDTFSRNRQGSSNIYDIELPNGEIKKGAWIYKKDKYEELKEQGEIRIKKLDNDYTIQIKQRINDSGKIARSIIDESKLFSTPNQLGTQELVELFGREKFSYPKPEELLKYLIEISTNENDLVLDFFAGSGTTLAVAHKMKRKYIGIEQMDYIESITKERLKKVIDGESGGISKAVEWSGGGSFIYCELAPLNASFIEKIENSRDENELNKIYKDLQKLAFIDYRVDIQNDLKDSEFGALSFEEKKRILKKCLDRNMDYIPYADMEDSEYKIDEQTRILNDIFYKKVEMI